MRRRVKKRGRKKSAWNLFVLRMKRFQNTERLLHFARQITCGSFKQNLQASFGNLVYTALLWMEITQCILCSGQNTFSPNNSLKEPKVNLKRGNDFMVML
jgi:hypothetical protein